MKRRPLLSWRVSARVIGRSSSFASTSFASGPLEKSSVRIFEPFAIAEGLGKNRVLRSLALCGLQITEARTVT
eukprot:COSAG01_NODE_28890_length_650_cov_0.940109_2_plen_72_part_01